MPIHLEGRDVMPEVGGSRSALIVACNMCAGASFAMEEDRPFIEFFRSFLTSPPLKRHIARLQSQLAKRGVESKWFKRGIIQKFFLCLWTSRQRRAFRKHVAQYDSVIVLGCDSAFKTVADALGETDCKLIEGTTVAGVMNANTRFRFPGNISFEHSNVATMCDHHCRRLRRESPRKETNARSA
ncbi:MAG: hypothetical protein ACYS9X_14375 [Planctomycetota bacterium]|jgi:hypothetical protein